MWPFDAFRKRKYDRQYNAALIVFLGTHMFERLSADQRARVAAEMDENFNRTDTPAVAWRRCAAWNVLAAYRAAAMARLGIAPIIPSLSWATLFRPWRIWRKVIEWPRQSSDDRAAVLVDDYDPMGRAYADAKKYLRDNGMNIPDADPPSYEQTNLAV
jgi:hypothetical protein